MSAHPTGRLAHRNDGLYLMLDRLFSSPIEDVWASLTRPAELAKWIGTYTGSPSTGAVKFLMSAEESADWEYVTIRECDAPHRFVGEFGEGDDSWRIMFHLVTGDGMTTLTFGQRLRSAAEAATVGPGWDYYLDRLVASRAGRPLPQWEHYYPAHAQYYKDLIVPSKSA
ncbi:SRPBCC domain-containing protein [Leifsonia sp. A12D58]|uniref:SRPBCC domain-containing protein n=1 Tax=Leifsonia sp. A12D58 TaxID=3397674 RepID=UPI0039E1E342